VRSQKKKERNNGSYFDSDSGYYYYFSYSTIKGGSSLLIPAKEKHSKTDLTSLFQVEECGSWVLGSVRIDCCLIQS
jgi:hypothetical protein